MQAFERLQPAHGIAIVRIVAGIVLLLAGWAKWTGPGIAGFTGFFTNVGIPLPGVMAPLVMTFELIGGIMLIAGIFTRYLGIIMIVQFLVAGLVVSLPSQNGWNAARLDFLLVAAGALFLFAGAGYPSVDAMLSGRRAGGSPARAGSF